MEIESEKYEALVRELESYRTGEGIAYLIARNGIFRNHLTRARKALIEVNGYLPNDYLTVVSEIDESGILK